MSRTDWIGVGVILLGLLLFLYGANYYNEIVGWTGLVLSVGGIIALIILFIYNWLTKQSRAQKP